MAAALDSVVLTRHKIRGRKFSGYRATDRSALSENAVCLGWMLCAQPYNEATVPPCMGAAKGWFSGAMSGHFKLNSGGKPVRPQQTEASPQTCSCSAEVDRLNSSPASLPKWGACHLCDFSLPNFVESCCPGTRYQSQCCPTQACTSPNLRGCERQASRSVAHVKDVHWWP